MIPRPPWSKLGKELESLCRKAFYDFALEDSPLGIAISGGKDSLTLLFLLHAISGRGFLDFNLHAIHVKGENSCGPDVGNLLKDICEKLHIPMIVKDLKGEFEDCYCCSRERRKLIFQAAKELGIRTVAFGHHRDDIIQTLLLNLLHKGEFAGMLPKLKMIHFDITIIRPLAYITEKQILEFSKFYGFKRITCQCPLGQHSQRKKVDELIDSMEECFPHARKNLLHGALLYGSTKAEKI